MSRALKQGFWATTLVYAGVLLGYLNRIVLFPKFLTLEEMGLYNLIISTAMLLAPLVMAGFGAVLIKFFPYFNGDATQKTRLYTFSFLVPLMLFLVWATALLVFRPLIADFFAEKSAAYMDYFHITILLTLLIVVFNLSENVARIHQTIVLPNFLREVFFRVFAFLMVILIGFGLLPFDTAVYIVLLHYLLALVILIRHLVVHFDFRIDARLFGIRKMWRKRILEFGGFSMLMGLSSMILLNIDQIFIAKFLGVRDNGIYTLAFFIAIIIAIPRRVVTELVVPKLSQYFRDKNLKDVDKLYKVVSIDQTLIAVVLLLGIVMSVEDLYSLIPKGDELKAGYTVVVLIAFAKLVEMTFSVSANIISMSPFFRYNVPLIGLFMVLNVTLNWVLIPTYGIDGAAAASLISVLLFSIAKLAFVWYRLGIQPFTRKVLWIYLIGIAIFLIVREIPFTPGTILTIGLRSAIIAIMFFVPIYLLKVSDNLNFLVGQFYRTVKNRRSGMK